MRTTSALSLVKVFLIHIVFILLATIARSQTDSFSNSFEQYYKTKNPLINYRYDSLNQIHDYSNNWDFDGDGITDQVFFIGTGGAHLYYFLRLVLSGDNVRRDYTFIESDFPVLPSRDEIKTVDYDPIANFSQFAVFDFNGDKNPDIFIRLDDQSFTASKNELKGRGITSKYILITFQNKKLQFSSYLIKKTKG